MLDMTGVGPGGRVLDVAAGAGGQIIRAAKRVGAEGYDSDPPQEKGAYDEITRAGLENTKEAVVTPHGARLT